MKCGNCPASYEINNENGYEWECLCGYEDDQYDDENGDCHCHHAIGNIMRLLNEMYKDNTFWKCTDEYCRLSKFYKGGRKIK